MAALSVSATFGMWIVRTTHKRDAAASLVDFHSAPLRYRRRDESRTSLRRVTLSDFFPYARKPASPDDVAAPKSTDEKKPALGGLGLE